jgi:hypothetical protein
MHAARIDRLFLALVAAQGLHSVEEYRFRLYDVLPPARYVSGLLGFEPSIGFLIVNAALFVFGLWCWWARVRPARPSARTYAWLWSLVEIANGSTHVLLAILAAGYFPGLATAPLLLALGGRLALNLSRTASPG